MNNNNDNVKSTAKKQKKIILIVFFSLVAFVILYFAISMINWDEIFKKDTDGTQDDYIYFYNEDLSKDLSTDEVYMGYDRSINLKIESSGITETILEEDLSGYNEAVNLLYSMIEYMTIGNAEAYNACFSEEYFSNTEPMQRFTKQKIYNITIIEVSQVDKTDSEGESYTEYYYKLDYMIRHNNGSLRNDMGSDCIKTQHIYLTDKSGIVLIDKIFTLNYIIK